MLEYGTGTGTALCAKMTKFTLFFPLRISSCEDHARFLQRSLGIQTFRLEDKEEDVEVKVRCRDGILRPTRFTELNFSF